MSRPNPPHNLDAEQGVLASIILEGGGDVMAMCLKAGMLPEWFFTTAHRIIFESAVELYKEGKSVDDITLPDILNKKKELNTVGGAAYINELTRRIEVTAHAKHWMEIVREKAFIRRVITAGHDISHKANKPEATFDDLRKDIMPVLETLATLGKAEKCIATKDIATDIITDFGRWLRNEKRAVEPGRMIEWGVPELDARFGRINPFKDFLITLGAESSHGKSTLFTHIIGHNLLKRGVNKKRCAVFLAENTRQSFILQMAGQMATFPTTWLTPDKSFEDWSKRNPDALKWKLEAFDKAMHAIRKAIEEGWLLLFEDCKTDSFITAQCRAIVREYGELHLVGVDYLQCLSSEDKELRRNREREVSQMGKNIRDFGKENNCPMLVISNLAKPKDGKISDEFGPSRHDLKSTGDIYFDSDRVIFLHRHETHPFTKQPQYKSDPVWCVLINQDKQRAGPTLRLHLRVVPSFGGIKIWPDQPALKDGDDGMSSEGAGDGPRHIQQALITDGKNPSSFFGDDAA